MRPAKCHVFLLGNYLYGLNWSCPNLSCMVVQQFNAAHLSANICRNSGAVLKCYEAHQPPSVSSPLPELLVEEGWASHASNKSTFSDISPWGPAQLSLTSLPMTQRIPKASHIFPPCQGVLEDLKALQPVHSILPSCAQGISRNIIRIFQDVYVS